MEILTEIIDVTSPKTFHTMLDVTSTDVIDKTSSQPLDATLAETSDKVKTMLLKKLETFRNAIHSPSANAETVLAEYDKLASVYDEAYVSLERHKKELAVDELESPLRDNKDALILDLAAGTGIAGQYLYNRGYKNLLALEPSQGMVNEAKKKNIYKKFIREIMNAKPTSIKDETYDAIIAVGAIATNHITDVAIPEILRITKKGGYIVILSPRHLIEPFESSMNELADQGAWRMLNQKLVPEYLREQEGILLSFQKSL